ncbi:MAG: energy-coupling factor ABC transporter permease, partial [Thermoguttaceae bacterium]
MLVGLALALWPAPALAMHIPENGIPISWAGLWFLVAAPMVFWGLKTINRRRAAEPRYMVLVALVGSAIFVISCMPVPIPIAKSCSHPCGTGLGAVLIGPGPTIVVASIALLLQALLLCHGGLTTWGANIVSMGVVGALTGYVVFRVFRRIGAPVFLAAFLAGVLSDWATYATTTFELSTDWLGDSLFWHQFAIIGVSFVPTQLPLGIAE